MVVNGVWFALGSSEFSLGGCERFFFGRGGWGWIYLSGGRS